MPCGQISGIVALDFDVKSGDDGPGEFTKLVRDRGETLPRTRAVRTPSGGLHHLFTCSDPIPSSKGKLGPGVEVKGDGTYILVAPSPGYVIEDPAQPAPLPEWIADLARGPKNPQPLRRERRGERKPTFSGGEPIPKGSRNGTLFFVALDLKDGGRSASEVLAGIEDANQRRCEAPLPNEEVGRMAASAMRYPIRSGNQSPEIRKAVEELIRQW